MAGMLLHLVQSVLVLYYNTVFSPAYLGIVAPYPFTTLMWDWGGANGFYVDTTFTQKYALPLNYTV